MNTACRSEQNRRVGKVYLVGAGPGDPELLTLKAVRVLACAEVVLYDRLVALAVLDFVPASAQRLYVGKRCGDRQVSQAQTEALLLHNARAGYRVVRLKGGDPFLLGRGGEEMQTLQHAGIEVEVVPGITAALGCAAYAGLPLTHRDYASSCLFLTGCDRTGALPADVATLTRRDQTRVIYMGLARLQTLSESLRTHGLPSDWPVAVIEKGTTPGQRVLPGNLATIAGIVADAKVQCPALVIVGRVVEMLTTPARAGHRANRGVANPCPVVGCITTHQQPSPFRQAGGS